MTPRQEEQIKTKIKRIKAALAADKKRWGGFYDDSNGLRYLPPALYIKLGDFAGGLRYLNWFQKNFPDDSGFPDFLFEWTIILFKKNKLREAEKKAFETFCSNTYLFDKFFGNPIVPIEKYEGTNLCTPDFCENLKYSSKQANLMDFSHWLAAYIATDKFIALSTKYIDIYIKLKTEIDTGTRRYLIKQANQLEEEA